MSYQMIFKRHEIKYLLTRKQKLSVLETMSPYMSLDQFGRSIIRNIYFDTHSYRLIRRSIEKPAYKEKLRLRSYKRASASEPIFVELKKKYRSVVYKRRIIMPQDKALYCLCNGKELSVNSQIGREIDYFCSYYQNLFPSVFLSYEREAYYALDGSDFRITFDENILSRNTELSFDRGIYGTPLLENKMTLMEVKTSGAIPLWMVHWLSQNKVYSSSFSKYGTAYYRMIKDDMLGGILDA